MLSNVDSPTPFGGGVFRRKIFELLFDDGRMTLPMRAWQRNVVFEPVKGK